MLLSTSGWATDAANLRQMITDYVGSTGTNIEMICTENNSVSSNPGKQSTSLVNGLFLADGLAQLMQTEIQRAFLVEFPQRRGFLRRQHQCLPLWLARCMAITESLEGTDYYPPYYTAKLMQDFVQPGDTVISAASD